MVAVTLSCREGSPITSSCAGVAAERSTGGMRGAIDSPAVGAAVVALAASTKKSKTMHDVRIAVS